MNRIAAALLLAASLLSACGEDTSVGGGEVFEFDQEQVDALGGSSTTVAAEEAAPVETTTTVAAEAVEQTTTTVTQTTTTLAPEQQEVSVEVLIQEDSTGQAFAPRIVAIPVGGRVRFVNNTAAVRSVVADNGAFSSGDIPPGGVWIFDATSPGQFNYTDGTRPYAVGTVDVQ